MLYIKTYIFLALFQKSEDLGMLYQIPMWQQLNELSGDTLPSDEECLSMILTTSQGFCAQHNQLVSCVTCCPWRVWI